MFASNSSQVSSDAVFIEDVFSTYLYTGNSTSGGTQTITNNIDLSTKGGMVWIKGRSAASDHILSDTARGAGASATNNNALASNLTSAEDLGGSSYDFLSAFNADGFTVKQGGTTTATRGANYNNVTYTSWTFRKQKKFFDVVTYTGNGSNRTIAHNLGSVPGCIIVKRTDTTADWQVYHRSLANTEYLVLNDTAAKATGTTRWNSTTPTSTVFSLGTNATVNANGGTYVAYLFAHDAGGFGTAGTDNVIFCGSYTGNSSTNGPTVNLGWEPQWLMIKRASSNNTPYGGLYDDWYIMDIMRGMPYMDSPNGSNLNANTNQADEAESWVKPTATGFQLANSDIVVNETGVTYIYIAIRRGPMKTPTSGTSVFNAVLQSASNTPQTKVTSVLTDMMLTDMRNSTFPNERSAWDRLRGALQYLNTSTTAAESNIADTLTGFDVMNGVKIGSDAGDYIQGYANWVYYAFSRAPSFFDEVCYTGNGASSRSVTHNLTVAPEMMIVKSRNLADTSWDVWHTANGVPSVMYLNNTNAKSTLSGHFDTLPTASVFYVGGSAFVNESGYTYVAYLFASCPGVSKVGSYTGSGTTKQIDCGFTGGARFVLIKRTDSTGDWYVWDTARGIVSGNDPYLLLNSTAAEVTNTDYIDAYSAGFEISSTAPAAINASGGTFIYMAIS